MGGHDDDQAKTTSASGGAATFVDAEAWLAQRGVERHALVVKPLDPAPEQAPGPQVRAREAMNLATEPPLTPLPEPNVVDGGLGEEVARLVAYARRATANAVMSEQRLRSRLADRTDVAAAIEAAMERCRGERLIDDAAMASALVDEGRGKGHADRRIRDDLRKRGMPADLIDAVVADRPRHDPDAAAFDLARQRAEHLGHLNADVAHRRLVAFLTRRGHPEGLAHKVAREVLFAQREQAQIAQR